MKNRFALHIIGLVALGATVHANAYQAEVIGSYSNTDFGATNTDIDTFELGGEYYINGVQSASGPFQEAAYLDQATLLRASYVDLDETDGAVIGGRFVDQNSGMLFDANVNTGDLDGFDVGLGMYLNDNSSVIASYIEEDDFTDGYGIGYKNLLSQNNGTYINLEAGVQFLENEVDQETTTYAVAGDYYLDKTLSFGLDVAFNSDDVADSTLYGINASKFLAQAITLEAALLQEDIDGQDDENTSFILGGKMRF